ncbi:MAG: multicopper oxidase family protein [Gemmatimonadaceae bacterium]
MISLRVATLLVAVAGAMFAATNHNERAVCPTSPLDEPGLLCVDLIPTPDLSQVTAALEIMPAASPFGVAVTVDGHPRQRLAMSIADLPAASSLGDYSVFVAWAYSIALDSAVKLGVVNNGRVELGELHYNQFRIIVSAERAATVAVRTGRLVLRGTSPSARLMAHRDFSTAGAMAVAGGDSSNSMSTMMHDATPPTSARWTMPPMTPGMPMMAGMNGLLPSVAPFRAGAGVDVTTLPKARPSTLVRLRHGDTLVLAAQMVRRTIGGKTFTMYGFNGQYPGPLIKVNQNATIVVQFENAIDQPSTVHWHGVRLDNQFDGVPGVTQPLVPPGGRFTYRVHFRDAGVYWYHPHHREDIQQDLGLYGNMLVRSADPNYYAPANREESLLLDDLLVGADGLTPHGAEAPTHALMGRFGNVFLVNGEPRYDLSVQRGEVVRFFLTNVANARIFNLSFAGARMKVVATDVGKFEREAWAESVVIGPAERYVVDVQFTETGRVALVNRVQALEHMFGRITPEADTMGKVTVSPTRVRQSHATSFATLRRNADVIADIDAFRPFFGKPVDHTVTLTLRARNLPTAVSAMLLGINANVDWNDGMSMMNWVATGNEVTWVLRDKDTGAENMDIAWRFTEGDVVKLRFINDPNSAHAMQHPIHLHGQRFLVLTRNGVQNDNLAWKDTAVIPAGESADFLVEMSNPGRWMMHCHVAEHMGSGMMGVFTVAPRH